MAIFRKPLLFLEHQAAKYRRMVNKKDANEMRGDQVKKGKAHTISVQLSICPKPF